MSPEVEGLFAAADLAALTGNRPDIEVMTWSDADEEALRAFATPATAADYAGWLAGHLRAGGRVTHAFVSPMPAGWMWVLRQLPESLNLGDPDQLPAFIVPTGLDPIAALHVEVLSFCQFYAMAGHFFMGVADFVPIWSDVRAEVARMVQVDL